MYQHQYSLMSTPMQRQTADLFRMSAVAALTCWGAANGLYARQPDPPTTGRLQTEPRTDTKAAPDDTVRAYGGARGGNGKGPPAVVALHPEPVRLTKEERVPENEVRAFWRLQPNTKAKP